MSMQTHKDHAALSGQDLFLSVVFVLSVVHGSAKAPGSLDHKTKAEAKILIVVGIVLLGQAGCQKRA